MESLAWSYAVLGVEIGTSKEEIKRAYRALVMQWHPDRFGDRPDDRRVALEVMKDINAAYRAVMQHLAAQAPHPAESAGPKAGRHTGLWEPPPGDPGRRSRQNGPPPGAGRTHGGWASHATHARAAQPHQGHRPKNPPAGRSQRMPWWPAAWLAFLLVAKLHTAGIPDLSLWFEAPGFGARSSTPVRPPLGANMLSVVGGSEAHDRSQCSLRSLVERLKEAQAGWSAWRACVAEWAGMTR